MSGLYPPIEPFNHFRLSVGDGHELYVEQVGNPKGKPVVVLHGGPGGGCHPQMRRFFDPLVYHVILFDQRGCGRSTPNARLEGNTTWDLVADIERIYQILGIETAILFGGSWGATLALAYAQTYPHRVKALVLRGVFLLRRVEVDWFYNGGAAWFWPEEWEKFLAPIPPAERGDMVAAYHRRLTGDDPVTRLTCARAWAKWEANTATLVPDGLRAASFDDDDTALAFARIECHYFHNRGFLRCDDQLLQDMDRIAHIPGVIVQGRYDMVCPPTSAHELALRWPKARLRMIADAGHSMSEPGISLALVQEMDRLR